MYVDGRSEERTAMWEDKLLSVVDATLKAESSRHMFS